MGDLGCFSITKDFHHPDYRPVNVHPLSRKAINTEFFLYTRKNPKNPYKLIAWDRANLNVSNFNGNLKTKMLIPGWIDKEVFAVWMVDLRKKLLDFDDLNVISINWNNLVPYYISVANTRVVGAEIANLIKFLEVVKLT